MNSSDCYLVFSCLDSKDCLFGRNIRRCENVVDCLQIVDSTCCYDVTIAANCYQVQHAFHVFDCSHAQYLQYCDNCSFCYDCSNLQNKQYCIQNIQYTKEEYFSRINLGVPLTLYNPKQYKLKDKHFINNEGVCGYEFIRNSKSVATSLNISDSSYLTYCLEIEKSSECFDCSFGSTDEMMYECIAMGVDSSHSCFVMIMTGGTGVYYSDNCLYSSYLFGCIGLRNKSYCIFNTQYSKEEYETIVSKIIAHMIETGERGEFFHPSLSPFGYNETVAMEYFPTHHRKQSPSLIREEKIDYLCPGDTAEPRGFEKLENFGYKRSTYEAPAPVADKIIDGQELPTTIETVTDDILKTAIRCAVTGKLFRIIPQELAFYRKHGIPLPRRHPDQRHKERMELRK